MIVHAKSSYYAEELVLFLEFTKNHNRNTNKYVNEIKCDINWINIE